MPGIVAAEYGRAAPESEVRERVLEQFVRAWSAVAYLYPGLHPDAFGSRGSGWPKHFKPFAAEAWRRFESGELTDNELYCYQAAKARIGSERAEIMRTAPWRLTDHFAA